MGLTRRQFNKEFKLAAVRRLEQGVSIAEANGYTHSGQRGSHTHSALPHFPQKCRRAGDSVRRFAPGADSRAR